MFGIDVAVALFYAFSAVLVGASVGVITARNPVYCVLFLVLAFFTAAALWLLLQVEFLGISLIVVYVGAVLVLFLFVVMMLDIKVDPLKEGFTRYLPVGIGVAIVMAGELFLVFWASDRLGPDSFPTPAPVSPDYSNTRAVGEAMYTDFLLPFEVAGVILLVAIVAAIALTQRRRTDALTQSPDRQIQVKAQERLRVVKMKSEAPATGDRN
ncbi:MAG: NADH-quinone oxidoreductase subunit J [Xanthomonadales bacterium]|jgi:NADH-quinone oxidoreductase subunit J|nr:NADH-quinone oxidoreductase subunit J [Xanthomonadales bacterium]